DNSSNANGTPFNPANFLINAFSVALNVENNPFFFTSGYPNKEIANFIAVDLPVLEFPNICTIILSKANSSPIYPIKTDDSEHTVMNSRYGLPKTSSLNIEIQISLLPFGCISKFPQYRESIPILLFNLYIVFSLYVEKPIFV